jgi:hypothetical protein
VWARKSDLQEERFFSVIILNPFDCPVSHIIVRVRFRRKIPGKGAEPVFVVWPLAVLDPLLLLMALALQELVPLIHVFTPFKKSILVLNNVPFMEPTGCLEWPGMHLADVCTVITGISEVVDPALSPRVRILEDTCGMGIVTGKQAGPGWRAGRCCYKAVGEVNPFVSESIQIGSLNMGKSQCPNGVIALLVRDDEYNVGLAHELW